MKITKRKEEIGTVKDLVELNGEVVDFKAKNREHEEVSLSDFLEDVVLISVFPDINTSVCDTQTRHFFSEASQLKGVKTLNISNNTVEQLNEWCATAGLDVLMLSDYHLDFGKSYGVYIEEVDLLARSIFVIDRNGRCVYKEVLSEITDEPDYEAAIQAAVHNS